MLGKRTIILFCIGLLFLEVSLALADKVCARINRGRLVKREVASGNCPRGFVTIIDTATLRGATGLTGATGPAGATGATGTDGAIRVYGNGSDGAVTFSTSGNFPENRQYTDIVINSGVTMTVQLGTVIRCTGTFTLNGLLIASGAAGNVGTLGSWTSSSIYLPATLTFPSRNIAGSGAKSGTVRTTSGIASGGMRGFAHSNSTRLQAALFDEPLAGGGHGAGAIDSFGGSGGGPIVVLCKQRISVPSGGIISTNGFNGGPGSGGGAGGTVLLASGGEISMLGEIYARGGNGGAASIRSASGGGGGGGLVHLFAPVINASGSTTLTGGNFGGTFGAGTLTAAIWSGGGGGGASGGDGGDGGSAASDGSSSSGAAGNDGSFYSASVDPTALLLMQ